LVGNYGEAIILTIIVRTYGSCCMSLEVFGVVCLR